MLKINPNKYSKEIIIERVNALANSEHRNTKRLYHCQAYVSDIYEGENVRYTILKSYNTIVAYYDHDDGTFYDVLRPVYGYTATSSQHISKFKKRFNIYTDIRYM